MIRTSTSTPRRILSGPSNSTHAALAMLQGILGLLSVRTAIVGTIQRSIDRLSSPPSMKRIALPALTEESQQGGLYLLRLSDTHYYGGRAAHFRARWRRHLTALEKGSHPNPYMQAVFDKEQQFEPEVLAVLDPDQRIPAEERWLRDHFGKKGCLNLSQSPVNNTHVSAEARAKISKAHKGRKQSPEAIRRSALSRTGLKMSPEARRNNSRAQTGKVMSAKARQRMSESSARKGKPIHENLRRAIVAANQKRKGEKRSDKVRDNLSKHVSGLVWVCAAEGTRRVTPSEAQVLLSQGWVRGRKYRKR